MRERLGIRCASVHQPVSALSGGNQQKVALAKLLAVDPRVLFVDEPTRGVDVGAKAQIHRILRDLADQGVGIVVISSELPELIGLCDRILVLHEGRIAGEVEARRHERGDDHAACLGACRARPRCRRRAIGRCGHERDARRPTGQPLVAAACPPA